MASIHNAKMKYAPELDLEDPLEMDEVISFLAEKSEVDPSEIKKVLDSMQELTFWYLVRARPIPIPGVGHLIPTVDLAGTFGATLEPDPELQRKMSEPEAYRAGVKRAENIGLTLSRLAQMWNSAHPDDQIADFDAFEFGA